jgi:PIN domain nuclease of toxin-antitoxin system
MNLILDTHTILWFFWDDPQLSDAAKAVITDPGNRKLVSAASCWEIAIKVSLKKLDLGEPFRSFMPREIAQLLRDASGLSRSRCGGVGHAALSSRPV